MKKALALLIVFTLCFAFFVGCNSDTKETQSTTATTTTPSVQEPAKEVILVKLGSDSAPDSYLGKACQVFTDKVNEKLDGQIKVELYLSEQLGNDTAMLENMQVDLQQAWSASIDLLSNYQPDLNIITMAFAFKSADHLDAFFNSEKGQELFQTLEGQNFHVLTIGFKRLPRGFLAKSPIASVDDMVGLKFRVPNIPIYEKNFTALGATPTFVAWSEYAYALMQGVVDAGESTYENIVPNQFYLYAPYITLTEYAYARESLVFNTQTWNKFTDEQKEIIEECAKEATDSYVEAVNSTWDADQKTILDSGAQFVDYDRQSFLDKVKPYAQQLEDEKLWSTPGLYDYIQSLKY